MFVYHLYVVLVLTQCVSSSYAASRIDEWKFYRNDYKYNSEAKGWLKYHQIPATWHEARLRCKYEGAVLASPLNTGIYRSMIEITSKSSYLEAKVMFIGIHATFSKGDFVSVEGVPLSDIPLLHFSSMCRGFVGNIKDIPNCYKDCVIVKDDGIFYTADCNFMLPYMCYKEDANVPFSICGAGNFEYKYEERTDSCYKVHTTGRTWSRGFMTCLGEGAHLAIINSELEAKVIQELLEKYPAKKILAEHTYVASIGALDWGVRGSWWTIHGDTLEEAGYSTWENGAPDSKEQFCVGVNRSGKLNDIWCNNYTFPLICEKKPTKLLELASEQ